MRFSLLILSQTVLQKSSSSKFARLKQTKCKQLDKYLIIEVRSFNMEIFIKAQFSIVQMSS